jgi:hypothetical protein
MRYRKVRIAWSVAWDLAAVLLIMLWVRSYWWTDSIWRYTPTGGTRIDSSYGKIIVKVASVTGKVPAVVVDTKSVKNTLTTEAAYFRMTFYVGFLFRHNAIGFDLFVPYWFLASAFATVATVPWIRCRFTVRTLLIATTLVALVLGLAVYVARQ